MNNMVYILYLKFAANITAEMKKIYDKSHAGAFVGGKLGRTVYWLGNGQI